MSPRVTLGVATYERDTYLAEAVASGTLKEKTNLVLFGAQFSF